MTRAPIPQPDLTPWRSHFPSLQLEHEGRPVIFFDNPGGTQVPQQVIYRVGDYYRRANANYGGPFVTSARTVEVIQAAHAGMADLLGGAPEEIIFGHNMTTLTFAFSRSIGRELQPGDEIVVTTLDHDANITPWRMLAEERGLTVRSVDLDVEDCTLDWQDFEAKVNERTRLVALGWASNATGTINDVRRAAKLAHSVGAWLFVDAVQAVPHLPCDVRELGCDFLVCSAYKFFGPHMGILWGRAELLERLVPYKVRPASNALPWRWETGTQNHEAQAGLLGTLDYLADIGQAQRGGLPASRRELLLSAMQAITSYEQGLTAYLIERLQAIAGVRIYGITDPARLAERGPTVALTLEGHTTASLGEVLGRAGINTWTGHYYALALVERLGLFESGGMLRIGLAHYNTSGEIDRLVRELEQLAGGTG